MGPEIIFAIPYALGFAAAATIGGTFAIWLIWAGLRRWGPRSIREASMAFPSGAVCSVLLCLALPVGCVWASQPVPQPESRRTVAAFEVPLSTPADRTDFLTILGREAAAEGLTLDAVPEAELDRRSRMGTDIPMRIEASIWRGEPRGNEAFIWDISQDDGHVWISFSRGEDRALAQRFRERVMREVVERWPGTLAVPVPLTGALPLRQDLIVTAEGYVIDPGRMARYDCPEKPGDKAAPPATC